MASIQIGKYALEIDDFSPDVDLDAAAAAGGLSKYHRSRVMMTIQILGAGSGGLSFTTRDNKTVTLTALANDDMITLNRAALAILSSGTSVTKVRVSWV